MVEPRVCASRPHGGLLPPQKDTFALTGCELRLRMWLQITVNQIGLYQAHNLECALAIAAELAGREYASTAAANSICAIRRRSRAL